MIFQLYLNGLLTLNENIADHGGLRIAYKAYKNYIKTHGPEELFAKWKFSAEQLFFLAFTHVSISKCGLFGDNYFFDKAN